MMLESYIQSHFPHRAQSNSPAELVEDLDPGRMAGPYILCVLALIVSLANSVVAATGLLRLGDETLDEFVENLPQDELLFVDFFKVRPHTHRQQWQCGNAQQDRWTIYLY